MHIKEVPRSAGTKAARFRMAECPHFAIQIPPDLYYTSIEGGIIK